MALKYTHEEAKKIRDIFRDALGVIKDMIAGNDRDLEELMKEIDLRATMKTDTLIRRLSVRSFSESEYEEIKAMIFVPFDSPEYSGDRKVFRKMLLKYQEGAEIADRCRTLQGLYGAAITQALIALDAVATGSGYLFSGGKNREKADQAYEELEILKQNGFLEELDSMWRRYRSLQGLTSSTREHAAREAVSDRTLQEVITRLHPGRIDADRISLPEDLTNGVGEFLFERLARMERHIRNAVGDRERLLKEISEHMPKDPAGQELSSKLIFLLGEYLRKEAYYQVALKYRKEPYLIRQIYADLEPMSDVMEWLRSDDLARLNAYRAVESAGKAVEDYHKENGRYEDYLRASDLTEEGALQDFRRNEIPFRDLLKRIREGMV